MAHKSQDDTLAGSLSKRDYAKEQHLAINRCEERRNTVPRGLTEEGWR